MRACGIIYHGRYTHQREWPGSSNIAIIRVFLIKQFFHSRLLHIRYSQNIGFKFEFTFSLDEEAEVIFTTWETLLRYSTLKQN